MKQKKMGVEKNEGENEEGKLPFKLNQFEGKEIRL
jgi:hypothetical protein